MRKLIFALLTVCGFGVASAQIVVPRQEIPYNVNYKWGIIDVMIARGNVTIQSDGNNFYGTLDGTSIPWEGHIICVSDTLSANINTCGGRINESVVYQNGWYRHPSVSSFRSATYNPDDPSIYKNIAGQGAYDASSDSMEAIAVTSDMLGMYYFAHIIDFPALKPGESFTVPIQGGYAREVTVTYQGQGIYSTGSDNFPTYDCTFEYSYGGSISGYPVECRIGATDRVPLFLSASLPVGRVEMLYAPQ